SSTTIGTIISRADDSVSVSGGAWRFCARALGLRVACELAGSEVTSPVECDSYSDRVHTIQVSARCARRIDDGPAVRDVHAGEQLQNQLGALRRVERPIRTVLEDRELEIR